MLKKVGVFRVLNMYSTELCMALYLSLCELVLYFFLCVGNAHNMVEFVGQLLVSDLWKPICKIPN